jgi:hypothetical protein
MVQEVADGDLGSLWARWREPREGEVRDALIRHYLPTVGMLSARLSRYVPESYRQTSTASGSSVSWTRSTISGPSLATDSKPMGRGGSGER